MNHLHHLLLFSFVLLLAHPTHALNWLDQKRQDTINQRRGKEKELLAEKQRKQQEESERMRNELSRAKEELRIQEQREREERYRQEREREFKAQEKRWQQERLDRHMQQEEWERKQEEAKEEQKKKQYEANREKAFIRTTLKNRKQALRAFAAAKGSVWITNKQGLFLFEDSELCEEYVEYRQSKAAYALKYARGLMDDGVIQANNKALLKVHESNYEELLPQEFELKEMCTEGDDVSAFESPESALQYLEAQADKKGIVLVSTMKGEEYWVAYHDLKKFATAESGDEENKNAEGE